MRYWSKIAKFFDPIVIGHRRWGDLLEISPLLVCTAGCLAGRCAYGGIALGLDRSDSGSGNRVVIFCLYLPFMYFTGHPKKIGEAAFVLGLKPRQFLILGNIQACGCVDFSTVCFISVYVYCIPILVHVFLASLVGPVHVFMCSQLLRFYETVL